MRLTFLMKSFMVPVFGILIMICQSMCGQTKWPHVIDGDLEMYPTRSVTGRVINLYGIAGMELENNAIKKAFGHTLSSICFTNRDALQNDGVRKKLYEELLREIAFQIDWDVTNLTEAYVLDQSWDAPLFLADVSLSTSAAGVELTKAMSTVGNLRYVKSVNAYSAALNKLKSVGRHVKHGGINHIASAAAALHAIVGVIDATDKGVQIYMTSMLMNAAQFELGLARLEALRDLAITEDQAYADALVAVMSELTNVPESYWKQLASALKTRQQDVRNGVLSFAGAVAHAASLINYNPLLHWVSAGLFVYKTVSEIQEWQSNLRKSSLAATLYMNVRNKASYGSNQMVDHIFEYSQHLFLRNMGSVLSYGYLRFWEFLRPGQKAVRVYVDDVRHSLSGEAVKGRINRFTAKLVRAPAQGRVAIGLILDSSGSMKENDPHNSRKTAVTIILDRLSGSEDIFLVDFDDRSVWLNPDNWEKWNKEKLKSSIAGINSEGGTNIGSGLQCMKDALADKLRNYQYVGVLLLTDGLGTYQDEARWFKENLVPIYTISFIGNDNSKLLSDIALHTGGHYYKANNEIDIVNAFSYFISNVSGSNPICSYQGRIAQGEKKSYSFVVDGRTEELFSSCTWPGSKIGLTLQSPKGKSYVGNEPGVELFSGDRYSSIKIKNPPEGKWTALLEGVEIPQANEPFNFDVHAKSPLKISLVERTTSGGPPTFAIVSTQDTQLIRKTSIRATVVTPTADTIDVSSSVREGVLMYHPVNGTGNYRFFVEVSGTGPDGSPFQRHFARTALVGDYRPSFMSPITMKTGMYLKSSMGSKVNNRAGLKCYVYPMGGNRDQKIAVGYVRFVTQDECTIQIQQYFGSRLPQVGDLIELDIVQWQRDRPR